MEKIPKGQVAKILVVFLFFLVTPFISASMRTSYLYFLLNLVIFLLAIDSGIVNGAFPAEPNEERKPTVPIPSSSPSPAALPLDVIPSTTTTTTTTSDHKNVQRTMKRCPSMPSLFFIGSDEDGDDGDYETEDEMDDADISAQELFAKAETFIGNFYRQLKIQREDSWRKISCMGSTVRHCE